MVGCLWPQRGQLGSAFSFQHPRLCGERRVSVLAPKRNDNCPAGGPCRILFHVWLESSSSATSRILIWTVSSLSLLSSFLIVLSLSYLLHLSPERNLSAQFAGIL